MTSSKRIEIALSKSKIVLMLLGALLFVAIGVWFVIAPSTFENSYLASPTVIAVVGYASIIFFGLCTFFFIRKLTDGKPGLIIDDTGLVDNSSGLSAGLVLWSDIENISVIKIHRQKLIMIRLETHSTILIGRQIYLSAKAWSLITKCMELL